MIQILLNGCNGRMGKAIQNIVASREDMQIVAGVDIQVDESNLTAKNGFPVFEKMTDAEVSADIIVDYSHHTTVNAITEAAIERKIPLVIATTGHTDEEKELIFQTAKQIPVFYTGNMSIGINLLMALSKKAAAALGSDFNIEIIEKHHNKKLDAPSGTALMLADAVASVTDYDAEYVYDRHSVRRPRAINEIGIHSVRGGNIVGEHEVLFAGENETIVLSHSALSRDLFANGTVRAIEFMIGKPAGHYAMSDCMEELLKNK